MEGSRSLERGPGSSPQVPKAEEAGQAVPLRPKARGLRRLSTCVIGSRASAPGRSAASRGGGTSLGASEPGGGGRSLLLPRWESNRQTGRRGDRPAARPLCVQFISPLVILPFPSSLAAPTILGASALQRSARASGVAVCLGLMSSPKVPVWPLDSLK